MNKKFINNTVFNIFSGYWNILRISKGEEIKAHCSFIPISNNKKLYKEWGLRKIGAEEVHFQQSYIYQLHPTMIELYNQKNMLLLHSLNFESKSDSLPAFGIHMHNCNHDKYSCSIKVYSNEYFEINYLVLGPDKNYIINSQYYKSLL